MRDDQLLRYSRHILLEQIGIDGQQRLANAHALIVGAGGLGSPVALYLAAAGVGQISIADPDVADLSNLQRQIAHDMSCLGRNKAVSASQRMLALNPDVVVHAMPERLDEHRLRQLLPLIDVVIDCSDNASTRYRINNACATLHKPLISGAATGFFGQLAVFDLRLPEHRGCYACVFPPSADMQSASCVTAGVFAPLVGIIGSMQAAEAIKILLGLGESSQGRLLLYDATDMQWTTMGFTRSENCPVCSK